MLDKIPIPGTIYRWGKLGPLCVIGVREFGEHENRQKITQTESQTDRLTHIDLTKQI